MARTVTEARRPDATAGTDTIYRSLFDSFNPDSDGRISPLEILSRLNRSGLIASTGTGPAVTPAEAHVLRGRPPGGRC